MILLVIALAALGGLLLSVVIHAASSAALLAARRRSRGEAVPGWTPGVSIVKPLCGVDEGLAENLDSFFRLDYRDERDGDEPGGFEVIFSFATAQDPAYPIARRVADRHPEIPSVFVFDGREPGGNAKVNRLTAGLRHARHRLILFSDGNVRVRPDFLRRAVSEFAPTQTGQTGLVSHLFFARGARGLAARLESLYLNGCLQGGTALLAGGLHMPCVVGKSILVSRAALAAIGGMGALREFLAEDFLLGREVRRAGYRVALSGDFLDTLEGRKSAAAVWARHRRWAIMRRRLGGALYAGELLAPSLPWGVAALVASRDALSGSGSGFALACAGLLAARYLVEAAVARAVGRPLSVRDALLLPVRDIAVLAVFWAGLLGSRVAWRGRALRVGPQTRILETLPAAPAARAA